MPVAIRYPIRRLFVGGGPRFDGPAIAAPVVELLAVLTGHPWELRNQRIDSIKAPEEIVEPCVLHRLRWRLRGDQGATRVEASLVVLLAETALNMSFQDYDVYRVTLTLGDGRRVLIDGSIGPTKPDSARAEGFEDDALRRACEELGLVAP